MIARQVRFFDAEGHYGHVRLEANVVEVFSYAGSVEDAIGITLGLEST